MKHLLLLAFSLLLLASCNNKATQEVSTIDNNLQNTVKSVLESKLQEFGAQSGQVIVMESQTGRIKALVGLERTDSALFKEMDEFCIPQPSGLFTTMSMLAMLESGKVHLSDTVDTGNGILAIDEENTIKDNNWHRGGYGRISALQGFANGSNVSLVRCLQKAFPNKEEFFMQLDMMSVHKPQNISGVKQDTLCYYVDCDYLHSAIGYDKCSPMQIIAFYNAIATGGKMIKPTLYEDSVEFIAPQIASNANIDSLKTALRYIVTDGLGTHANSDKVKVAGKQGTIQLADESYNADFCGYFPADAPKYIVFVSINKKNFPASGGSMAAPVFKVIAEQLGKNTNME